MIYVILHNIRSTHNVGSIFRTADALGVTKIFLSGYTPSPLDRFGNPRPDIAKVSLGAEKNVAWEHLKRASALISRLKGEGVEIIAIEQDKSAQDYKKVRPKLPAAFLFGNEVRGLSKELRRAADTIAEIPMKGKKESLNVSVSFAIALFRILDR